MKSVCPMWRNLEKRNFWDMRRKFWEIYLSGHPLENYREMMEKTISAKTSDFQQDEETNLPKVMDGQKVIIGGMITDKNHQIYKE